MSLKQSIDKIDSKLVGLYGSNVDVTFQKSRFLKLIDKHEELFNTSPSYLFSTSGRTELGGNHTDHNLGCVLAASINLDTIAAVSKTDDNKITLISEGFDPVYVDLTNLEVQDCEKNTTNAIVRGIVKAFDSKKVRVTGFKANTSSLVLKGSGLSSSAAIEVLIATIINHLFNNDSFSTTTLAQIGQYAENKYFGKPSGLMDQVACANGQIVSIDFKDIKNPKIKPVPFNFEDYSYSLVIIDTGGNHANLTEEYSAIPMEMKAIAHLLGHDTLSEVDENEFISRFKEIRAKVKNDRAMLRAFHFINETQRAKDEFIALENKDMTTYLKLVRESGKSSYEYLQNVYCITNKEEQPIALGLALCDYYLKDEGAYRLQGGGFAGTIQAYVPINKLEGFIQMFEKTFNKGCCTIVSIRELPTCCVLE